MSERLKRRLYPHSPFPIFPYPRGISFLGGTFHSLTISLYRDFIKPTLHESCGYTHIFSSNGVRALDSGHVGRGLGFDSRPRSGTPRREIREARGHGGDGECPRRFDDECEGFGGVPEFAGR